MLKGLIHKVSTSFGSLTSVSSYSAYSEPPAVFYYYNPQGLFSHHWPQFTNDFPLLDLLKLSDSPSKILAATICLFLLVVTRKCIAFIVLQYGKFDASKIERLAKSGEDGLDPVSVLYFPPERVIKIDDVTYWIKIIIYCIIYSLLGKPAATTLS